MGPAVKQIAIRAAWALVSLLLCPWSLPAANIVAFPSGAITLHGVLYKPEGTGPFPAVVYNHGSAAGMLKRTGIRCAGPSIRQPRMGILWAIPARSRLKCVGWSLYWRSDRCGAEERRHIVRRRNHGPIARDGSSERPVVSARVVTKAALRSSASNRGGRKLL